MFSYFLRKFALQLLKNLFLTMTASTSSTTFLPLLGELSTPIYIIEERLLRRNLRLIADVAQRADIEVILAFKAFALWKTFPIFREYIHSTTASSLNEVLLAAE